MKHDPGEGCEASSPTEWGQGQVTRRQALKGLGLTAVSLAGLGSVLSACGSAAKKTGAAPTPSGRPAPQEEKVVYVRSLGGAYEASWKTAAWDPFEKATGIKVVGVTSAPAAILASAEAGRSELDVIDLGEFATIQLSQKGALLKVEPSQFILTDLADLTGPKNPYYLPSFAFSTVLGYSTKAFGQRHPSTWSEWWDTSKFPGKRTLESLSAGNPNLEQALLADGVPMGQVFPIDIPRAFKKLAEIKSSIVTYWSTGAQSAELFTTGSAVTGAIWNGRLQVPINGGYPAAIEWNQAERLYQAFSIPAKAPHPENAYKFIDFSLQPKVLAEFATGIYYGPTNKLSYKYIPAKAAALLPTSREHEAESFAQDAQWWVDNFSAVSDAWSAFLA